jgi:hypothetical protein
VGTWTLRGDKGLKNGERKLRTAITRRAEWREESLRSRAADEAEASGLTELASALRSRDSSRLRKPHLFALCRMWHIRCDIWERRAAAPPVGGGRRRHHAGAASAHRAASPGSSAGGASAAHSQDLALSLGVPVAFDNNALLGACMTVRRTRARARKIAHNR